MDVESDSDNLLGKEIQSYNNLHIYENGIIYDDDYLLWDEIEQVFIRGKQTLVNFSPILEDRMIRLVDSSGERQIKIFFSSVFFMKEEKLKLFSNIYSIIINKIAPRQLKQFVNEINAGKAISYKNFEITHDAFYIHEAGKNVKRIDNQNIMRHEIDNGCFYILYLETEDEIYKSCIGTVEDTPNIHILQAYIDSV